MEPISAAAIFSGIGTAFKFAEYALRLAEVGSENEVFVRTIQVVRTDLHEVERLLQVKAVQQKLIGVPAKFSWIKSAITSTKMALHDIGQWVERARVDQEAIGSVKFETRVRWIFNDHEKLRNRKTELSICHQQLSNVLNFLVPLEEIPATAEPPAYRDVARFEDLLSPHSLRQAKSYASFSQKWSAGESSTPFSMHAEQREKPKPNTSSEPLVHTNDGVDSRPSTGASPPTYAVAVSSMSAFTRGVTASSPHRTLSEVKSLYEPSEGTFDRKQQVWAYRNTDFQQPNNHVPELQGTPVAMSATNPAGPVNPFEVLSEEVTPQRHRLHKASGPFELPGDNQQPAELDAGLLGRFPSWRSSPGFIEHGEPALQVQLDTGANNDGPGSRASQRANYVPSQIAQERHDLTNAPPPILRTTSTPVNRVSRAQISTQQSVMDMLSALDD